MNKKLVLVEGLPGSGKTTTATMVESVLKEMGLTTELYLEGNLDHPADYEAVASFTEEEFNILKEDSAYASFFENNGSYFREGPYYLVRYLKLKNEYKDEFPYELLERLSKNDIYELPFEQNEEIITASWRNFASKAVEEEKVYIFECCFIQNPVTVGMIKYGLPKEKSVQYVERLQKSVESLNPLLIYVHQDDIEFTFSKAVEERPKEWSDGFMHYYTQQGYGKNQNLEGFSGTVEVLKARRELEGEIIDQLNMQSFVLNNTKYNKDESTKLIRDVLTKYFSS
ncbi:hypothetical protein SM124_22980 [Bacillus sp. 31A1R]|uniref:AAA domain-containing protein n=1 Tax=Robertmurraya mangrovi TaxID=3098077 RepID=A0ABU5J551_9BACI|nr:hypothetical protein [Bacillus sp. 31A1R]MDZ5474544.1 hypothetical protein [Bacillus sp. 31A1R]